MSEYFFDRSVHEKWAIVVIWCKNCLLSSKSLPLLIFLAKKKGKARNFTHKIFLLAKFVAFIPLICNYWCNFFGFEKFFRTFQYFHGWTWTCTYVVHAFSSPISGFNVKVCAENLHKSGVTIFFWMRNGEVEAETFN